MVSLTAVLAAAVMGWDPVGGRLRYENVTAVSSTFAMDGTPTIAFGYNETEGRTNIPVYTWSGSDWELEHDRRSQFAQGYHDFAYKVRGGKQYLGLKIDYRYGSVLNGAEDWRGSYAFHNQLFDYEIDANGDMCLLWISESPTTDSYPGTGNLLVVEKYTGASGWAGSPAAFTRIAVLATQTPDNRVSSVKLAQGPPPATDSFYGAYVLGGVVHVFQVVENGTVPIRSLGGFAGEAVDLAVSALGAVTAYYHAVTGKVHAKLLALNTEDWMDLGVAIPSATTSQEETRVSIAEDGTVVVAARLASDPSTLAVVRWRIGTPVQWINVNYRAAAPITEWDLHTRQRTIFATLCEGEHRGIHTIAQLI